MLTPTQQLDQLGHIREALDYIEPALREVAEAGHRVRIDVAPAYLPDGHASVHQIRFQMFQESSDQADAANLASLLSWTETGEEHTPGGVHHYRWYGTVGGFRAVLMLLLVDPASHGKEGHVGAPDSCEGCHAEEFGFKS
jgi:hypothetical protein